MSNLFSLPVVLIVTSDLSKLSIFKKILKDRCHLLEQREGKRAIEMAKTTLLDMIIVDEKLSDIDPLKFCRTIRKIATYYEIPIVLMTQKLKKTFFDKATLNGVTDFLNEPLDRQEIEKLLTKPVSKQKPPEPKP